MLITTICVTNEVSIYLFISVHYFFVEVADLGASLLAAFWLGAEEVVVVLGRTLVFVSFVLDCTLGDVVFELLVLLREDCAPPLGAEDGPWLRPGDTSLESALLSFTSPCGT